MHTNRIRLNRDFFSIHRPDNMLVQNAQDARSGFLRIVQKRVRSRARNKRTVGQIMAIGEDLACQAYVRYLCRPGESTAVRSKKNEPAIDRYNGTRHCLRQGRITRCHIVKRAMRLNVVRSDA